ncbi:MAG: MetQ/NlpA family ABC transporter substrate-binding protein [Deltaproteobacteria bacterium]|jgi:D-methionine transport system substrate-binding protein|nr:MetQ/NlpA family ABC transporter substrate-binding protein [Deltaproteobacteria bacterium]
MTKLLTSILAGLVLAFSVQALAQDSIKVATTSGADVVILEKAAEVAKGRGLNVEIVEMSDYILPNMALLSKDVDLNSFQHVPYLDDFNKERNTGLVSIGITYVAPIAFFSKRIKTIDELKEGDSVVLPNDPSNGGRCLLLLQKTGAVKVRPEAGLLATPSDVTENKLGLKLIEVDPPMTPRALDDATLVCINNTFSVEAGLNPLRDSVFLEDAESPYANIIAARPEDKDNPLYLKFVEAYQSQEVADFILEKYEGATIPLFKYEKK